MSFVRFLSWFALSGVLVPLIFQVVWWLVNKYQTTGLDLEIVIQKLMLILWPSSLMTLPAGSDESLLPISAVDIDRCECGVLYFYWCGPLVWIQEISCDSYSARYRYERYMVACIDVVGLASTGRKKGDAH